MNKLYLRKKKKIENLVTTNNSLKVPKTFVLTFHESVLKRQNKLSQILSDVSRGTSRTFVLFGKFCRY